MKNRKNRPVNGKVFRSGVYSTAILAAAILLAVLVNLVVRAIPSKYTEFDLSEGKMYTLGDSSVQLAQSLRQDVTIPLVFMTYANVVFSYGADALFANCAKVGIDGIILPDLPFEEKDEFQSVSRKYGVDLISLIAPTSHQRIAMIAREAEGFLYIVSSLGVTGTRSEITTDLASIIQVVRENTDVPCAIGFGISTPAQARQMAELADGVIVGSAIIKLLQQHGTQAAPVVGAYVKEMKQGIMDL